MLDKLEKLEELVNKALEALGKTLLKLLLLVVPRPLASWLASLRLKLASGLLAIKQGAWALIAKIKAELARAYRRIASLSELFRHLSPASIKQKLLKAGIKPRLPQFIKVPPTQVVGSFFALLGVFVGAYGIYVSGQNMYMKEWGSRAPASVASPLDRPEYLKLKARTLEVFNIKIPLTVESVSSIRSVTVDFAIRTDTRFATLFLKEYEYKLKDYFFTTTEPVISSFPLEEEGKAVLKDKIQYELNNFLKEERVEGQVLEVDILFIVGH